MLPLCERYSLSALVKFSSCLEKSGIKHFLNPLEKWASIGLLTRAFAGYDRTSYVGSRFVTDGTSSLRNVRTSTSTGRISGATENAGVENAIRAKLQGWKMQEWKKQE